MMLRLGLCLSVLLTATNASSEQLTVTLLGTGTPQPSIDRFGPSILVEGGDQALLFDVGRGSTIRLNQVNVPLNRVTKVFLTHLHSDHTVGLPDLMLTGWIRGRTEPLQVWGPRGTAGMMMNLSRAYAPDVGARTSTAGRRAPEHTTTEVSEGVVYRSGGVTVTAFEVTHINPSFGYRIDYASRSVVLSGDTSYSENLIRFAQGADLLVHEVLLTGRDMPAKEQERLAAGHTSPSQAAAIFGKVQPRLAVYSHILISGNATDAEIIPTTQKAYSGRVELGEDLMTISIGSEIRILRHRTK